MSRHSDFLYGLPSNNAITAEDLDSTPMAPADQLRLVHTYITSTQSDGGLGIAPGSPQWDRVESVVALHDQLFNDTWIKAWTTTQLGLVSSERVKSQVSLYVEWFSTCTDDRHSLVKQSRYISRSYHHIPSSSSSYPPSVSGSTSSVSHTPLYTRASYSFGLSRSWSGGGSRNGCWPYDGARVGRSGSRSVGRSTNRLVGGGES